MAAVVSLVVATAGWWALTAARHDDGGSQDRGSHDRDMHDGRSHDRAVDALLEELSAALEHRDAGAARALAADGDARAARELADLVAGVRALDVVGVRLRRSGDADAGSGRGRVVTATLSWRLAGVDRSTSTVPVPLRVRLADDRAHFVTARLPDELSGRAPLWWLSRVRVHRSPGVMVASAAPGGGRLLRPARQAVEAVHRLVPGWSGPLVVEAPHAGLPFDRLAGVPRASAGRLTAVTSTADGSTGGRAAVRVVLNPRPFATLGPVGARLVLTHEATHVALDPTGPQPPRWLAEGLADHVAVGAAGVPVRVAATELLEHVRREGPPPALPSDEQLSGADPEVGAWYEAAHLGVRLLARRLGTEARLLRFHRTAAVDGGTRRAFRALLGTTEARFTSQWRSWLRALADRPAGDGAEAPGTLAR